MTRLRLPFEWLVALRYLREGRLQTVLILAGVTGGVAVIIFLTTLITQLQASIAPSGARHMSSCGLRRK
jgi:lipoprotein-releasing system permease protein